MMMMMMVISYIVVLFCSMCSDPSSLEAWLILYILCTGTVCSFSLSNTQSRFILHMISINEENFNHNKHIYERKKKSVIFYNGLSTDTD
jgi:uncharacterized radical SAM superfamily protein